MYKKILVCVDDTPLSQHVTQVAADLAGRYGASIVLLSIVDPARMAKQPYSGLEAVQMIEKQSRSLSNTLHRTGDRLTKMGILNQEIVVSGRSVESILRVAESETADLIVIGSTSRSRMQAWLNSDLWNEVSHKAACNVLRVTPGDPGKATLGVDAPPRGESVGKLLSAPLSAL
jgi:nucleotide-binding universal stress UspA family protein